MKKSFKLLPLLLCLLYSIAQATPPSQKDFEFLEPFDDTALEKNGLKLTKKMTELSLSTLVNLSIWLGVCKTAGIVSGLSSQYNLAGQDKQELESLKMDFCSQLAPLVITTEAALAGRVSPWPLEQHWWKLLYVAGMGMAGYAAYIDPTRRKSIPVEVLSYLVIEAGARTGASATSVLTLRKMNVRDIATKGYVAGEYEVLSMVNGFLAGAVVYEAMIHKGFSPAKAAFARVVSAAIAGTLLGIISLSTIDVDGQAKVGAVIGAGAGALAGAGAEVRDVAEALAVAGAGAGAVAGAAAGAGAGAEVRDVAVALAGTAVGAVVEVAIVAKVADVAGYLLMRSSSKITSNNPLIIACLTLVPTLTIALFNSFSNYAVYGYSLEEGLSETARTQWKKFYAPLDYLRTLFN